MTVTRVLTAMLHVVDILGAKHQAFTFDERDREETDNISPLSDTPDRLIRDISPKQPIHDEMLVVPKGSFDAKSTVASD